MARFFGQYLLEKGVLTREQLLEALGRQKAKVEKLGEVAMRLGYLKENDVEKIRREQQHTDLFFGQLAVKLGLLTEAQVGELLNIQRANHVYLGEVLVELRYLTRDRVEEELKQFRQEEEEDQKTATLSLSKDFPYRDVLDILASASEKHFRRVADMLVKVSEVKEEKGETPNPYLSVFIDLTGDIKGSCLLKLSREAAQQVVKQFSGGVSPEKDEGYVRDAVSEFFNILCGNLLSKFMEIGKMCDISVPRSFFSSEKKMLPLGEKARAFTISFATTEGSASVSFVPAN